jgi:hypothetical protein
MNTAQRKRLAWQVVSVVGMGSFDSVRLSPHSAQDDKSVLG